MIREPIKIRWGVVATMLFIPILLIDIVCFSSKIAVELTYVTGLSNRAAEAYWKAFTGADIYWKALLALFSVEVLLMLYAFGKEQIKTRLVVISRIVTLLSVFMLLGFASFSLGLSLDGIIKVLLCVFSVIALFMVLPLRYFEVALGVVSIVLLLAGYTYLSNKQHVKNPDDRTIPTWSQLKQGVVTIFKVENISHQRWIVVDSKATAKRLFFGLLYGVLGAIALGLLMGCYRVVEAFFVLLLSWASAHPATAMLAVFFVLVGTGENMFITMIAFGVLPTLAQSIYLAAKKDVPDELLFKAYTLGASDTEVILCIVYRHILPKIIDAVRLCIGPAIVFLIAAEMLCASIGFGYRMRLQSRLFNMDVVYLYIELLVGFYFALNYGLKFVQKKCCPWYTMERG